MITGKDYGLPAEYADWVEVQPHAPLNTAATTACLTDTSLLADVNDDGFTVEPEGL